MERLGEHRRNEVLEDLLQEVNDLLEPVHMKLLEGFRMPDAPVLLVMGLPRSGTTVLMQWLANMGVVSYPTNLLSRFFRAPTVGARLQLLLTDRRYDFRNELWDLAGPVGFESSLGKTRGALAPSEFWYFWRRFFPLDVASPLPLEVKTSAEPARFVAEIAALESILGAPFAMKGGLLTFDVPLLDSIFERVLLLHIQRDPLYNMQSLLESRVSYYGAINRWYSIRPPEYEWLKDRDPYTQVAGQVYFSGRALQRGLSSVAPERRLEVRYEDFCADPARVLGQIAERFASQGWPVDWKYTGPPSFECTNQIRIAAQEADSLARAFEGIAEGGT